MLSSIHPLGERGRNNRWGVTVTAFATGAVLSGGLVGAALGLAGSALFDSIDPRTAVIVIGLAAVAAGVLDLAGVSTPGPTRQVNEHWIGRYRGWVYGGAFGAQLGLGVVTFVVTWGVYATLLAELVVASPGGGALVGAAFGLGRSLSLLSAGTVRRPSDLTSFHRLMARLGPPVRHVGASVVGVAGLIAIAGVVL